VICKWTYRPYNYINFQIIDRSKYTEEAKVVNVKKYLLIYSENVTNESGC